MKHLLNVIVVSMNVAGLSGIASAQAKPEDTIKNRKSSLTLVQSHMKTIGAMLKGERPLDAAFVAKNAALIETLAREFPDGFPAGTDRGDTKARPEIWSQPDKFRQATSRYQSEANKFTEVARTGNVDNMKAQFGALAKSCGACHEDFRNK